MLGDCSAHREPVAVQKAPSVASIGIPRPPKQVLDGRVRERDSGRIVFQVLGHVAQEQHIRLLQGSS